MPRVVFVYPEFENLGVATLMAVSKNEGYDVELLLYRADNAYLGVGGVSPRYGKIAKRVLALSPDIAAFSAVTDNYLHQLAVAREVKRLSPEVFVIFGGIHATSVPGRVLSEPAVDAIAIGEAEISFAEFLRTGKNGPSFKPASKVPKGIYLRSAALPERWEEGELPDLDSLPFAEKEPFYRQQPFGRGSYMIAASRGCPYGCSYCSNAIYRELRCSAKVRWRSPANVIEELRLALSRHRPANVVFVDDSFTTDARWLEEFLPRYRDEIGLPFACNAIPALLTPNMIKELKKAGCVDVQIGAQTLDEKLSRDVLRRKPDNKALAEAIILLRREGLLVQVDHMFGIPGATPETEEEAAAFYNRVRPHIISVFWLTYYPGAPIVETARSLGILNDADIERIEAGLPLTGGTLHSGGSLTDPSPWWGIHLLMNWLPFLPRNLAAWILEKKLHRRLPVSSYFFSTAIPRVLRCMIDSRYFLGRGHILRMVGRAVSRNH